MIQALIKSWRNRFHMGRQNRITDRCLPASADRLEQLLRALLKGKGGSTGLAARDVALETALENLEMNKVDSALQLPWLSFCWGSFLAF